MQSAGRGLRLRGARPACVVLVRHTATRPTASAAGGSAAVLLGEPAAARHRRTETTGKRWLTGAETAARRDGDGRWAGSARRR
jgi:hypothetical protein